MTALKSALLVCLIFLITPSVRASVQVLIGPTPILDGEAKAASDITVVNEKLAFALAVGSPVPYGVPRGALIDVAPVTDGTIGQDCVVFADFIPYNWSAWPNTYQHIDILERGPRQVVIRTVRDWGKVAVTTVYTLESNSDSVQIRTTMKNDGDGDVGGLLSGFTLWPKRGYLFAVPGLAGIAQGAAVGALTDRVVAYDEHYTVVLHAPYVDHIADGSMDMYRLHSLRRGESRMFDAWLQVGAGGDLKPIIMAEIVRKRLQFGKVHGAVTTQDGKPVETPVVVVEKQGKPYAWVLGARGAFELSLPVGDYSLYATAKNYSQSAPTALSVTARSDTVRDFGDLRNPGRMQFSVTDAKSHLALDARISIVEGQKPLVEFLGRKTFFTELDRQGHADLSIAPGNYVFSVSSGGGFLAERQRLAVELAPGESKTAHVAVNRLFDPPAAHWYSADMHHHADQAEAVTPAPDLARSQLAAGLDLLFVSDHDSTVNHRMLQAIADRRGVPFIPAIEMSASWGHFNAYPLDLGQTLRIDTATASIDDILKEGRRQGAVVVQVNHPFIPYGYFTSVRNGVAPGGFNPAFDLIEINAGAPSDDVKVLRTLWDWWNRGHHYYLSAGTDTHDVWHDESGAVRAFAHVDGALSARAFAQSLKDGHGYITFGPLIFPAVMFGDELKVTTGEAFRLGFDLKSVAGVKRVELIGAGVIVNSQLFDAPSQQVRVDFPLSTSRSTWYSLIVEDRLGHRAYTDPIWVDVIERPVRLTEK